MSNLMIEKGRAGIYVDRELAVYQGSEAKSDRSSGGILEKSKTEMKFESMMLQRSGGELSHRLVGFNIQG